MDRESDLYGLKDIAEVLGASSAAFQSLRLAAQLGALGDVAEVHGRANMYRPTALYRAALFLTLHRRCHIPAPMAGGLVAGTPGFVDALAEHCAGTRMRFEVQHVARDVFPVCDFAPWDAPRSGTGAEADGPPVARTVIDLQAIWRWLDPYLGTDE